MRQKEVDKVIKAVGFDIGSGIWMVRVVSTINLIVFAKQKGLK
jgi:hypothetical protein